MEVSSVVVVLGLRFEEIGFPLCRILTRSFRWPFDLTPRSRFREPSSFRLRAARPRSRKSE